MTRILILGGTKEASDLAAKLVRKGHEVTTSLAGRTKEPEPLAGQVRIGGFGGVEGLAGYLIANGFEKLIDATHPFAKQISANADAAARQTGIEFERIVRAPWQKQNGDRWIEVGSLSDAREKIPGNARVLLALGSQYIDLFKSRKDVFFLVRTVDEPAQPLSLTDHQLVLGKPSRDWQEEAELIAAHNLTHIVCRNSGGDGAYAKIKAARHLGLTVIIVAR